MKLLLIVPRKDICERDFFDFRFTANFIYMKKGFWGIPLAIPTIAAMTPPHVDVRIVDENVEAVPLDYDADVVGITVMSLQAIRAYELADLYQRRGVKVVLGGIHVSMLPNEAKEHADSVFIGEAEGRWHQVIEDAENGELKPFYHPLGEDKPDLKLSPPPRRDLLKNKRYVMNPMQTSRGCPFNCDFCSVQDFLGSRMRYKTHEQIMEEIRNIYQVAAHDNSVNNIIITDDNLVGNRKRAYDLLTNVLIPMNEEYDISGWMCQCSVDVARDNEILELLKHAGCHNIFIGFESLKKENLKLMSKRVNLGVSYADAIETIRSYGIDVIGSFILGGDEDTVDSFGRLVEFIDDNCLLDNLINILMPFPGTKLFERLQAEGRILHYDWSKYDLGHVVFRPKRMTVDELEEGYIWVHEQVYSFKKMYEKMKHHMWKRGPNPLTGTMKLKMLLRLLCYLGPRDWARNKFIMKSAYDILNPNLAVQATSIVWSMDHQDFVRRLRKYRNNLVCDSRSMT